MATLLLALGFVAALGSGVLLGRATKKVSANPDSPTCGCGHSLALHDPQDKDCSGRVRFSLGFLDGFVWRDCRCRRYVGPLPINDLWIPPTMDGER